MKVKVTIISLVILELVTIVLLGRAMVHNFVWEYEATTHARRTGGLEAARDYRRGHRRVLEAKAIDTAAQNYSGPAYDFYQLLPTKEKKDGVELWHIVQSPELSKP